MAISFDPERLHQQIRPFSVAEPFVPGDAEQTYFHYYSLDIERRIPGVSHYFGHFSSGKYDIVAHYFSLDGAASPAAEKLDGETVAAPAAELHDAEPHDEKKSTGTCFIFHGYFDHSGLYANLIEYCLRRNLNVVIYDLAGHGLSTGERVSIPSFSEYVSVMKDALKFFGDIAPQPWHAIGQSTGGAMLMDYMLQELAPGFDKVVLLAPLLRAAEWRWIRVAYWVGQKFLERVPRRFGINSNHKPFTDFIEHQDPLQTKYISVRWVDALLRWESRFEYFPPLEKPILIIQGQRDTTVDWRYNIPAIRRKFPRAKYLPLQDAYHHLANESPEIRQKIEAAMDMYFDEDTADRS